MLRYKSSYCCHIYSKIVIVLLVAPLKSCTSNWMQVNHRVLLIKSSMKLFIDLVELPPLGRVLVLFATIVAYLVVSQSLLISLLILFSTNPHQVLQSTECQADTSHLHYDRYETRTADYIREWISISFVSQLNLDLLRYLSSYYVTS